MGKLVLFVIGGGLLTAIYGSVFHGWVFSGFAVITTLLILLFLACVDEWDTQSTRHDQLKNADAGLLKRLHDLEAAVNKLGPSTGISSHHHIEFMELDQKIDDLDVRVNALSKKIDEMAKEQTEAFSWFKAADKTLTQLSTSIESIKKDNVYQSLKNKALSEEQAKIAKAFEQLQNTQAHVVNRELMAELEIFKSAFDVYFAMYRHIGHDNLPDDARKQMEERIMKNVDQIFEIAGRQRNIRNAQFDNAINPPPIPPEPNPIDVSRDILALDDVTAQPYQPKRRILRPND